MTRSAGILSPIIFSAAIHPIAQWCCTVGIYSFFSGPTGHWYPHSLYWDNLELTWRNLGSLYVWVLSYYPKPLLPFPKSVSYPPQWAADPYICKGLIIKLQPTLWGTKLPSFSMPVETRKAIIILYIKCIYMFMFHIWLIIFLPIFFFILFLKIIQAFFPPESFQQPWTVW